MMASFCTLAIYPNLSLEITSFSKKDLHVPDNHDGVITDLVPDILECEVKSALGSITTNKASGGDGTPVEAGTAGYL